MPAGESDRWRPGTMATDAREMVLKGGCVVTADASKSVVCLWGESTRYAGRKNGYHGGVSLQEVTGPLRVLMTFGTTVPGWQPALPAQPKLRDLPIVSAAAASAPAPRTTGRRPAAATSVAQQALFEPPAAPATPVVEAPGPDWIGALLQCSVYVSQRPLAARVALPNDQMRKLLAELMQRGGMVRSVGRAARGGLAR